MNLAGGFCWREWRIFSNCVPGLSFQVNGWGHVGFHCIQPNLQSTGLLRSLGYDTLENRNLAKIGYRFHIGVLRTPLWQGRYMWNLEAHPGLQTSCQWESHVLDQGLHNILWPSINSNKLYLYSHITGLADLVISHKNTSYLKSVSKPK